MFKDLREIMTVKSEQMWSINRKTKAIKKKNKMKTLELLRIISGVKNS